MRAVGGEDGGAYVSADLRSAQHAWSPCAWLLLQRGRRAIPALMPARDGAAPACDCVAGSECSEAASSIMWGVLEEDVVLGFSVEVRHGCAASELQIDCAAAAAGRSDEASRCL